MPLTTFLGVLAPQVALDLDALQRLRRANRQLRCLAFWRNGDKSCPPSNY
jgi:hypothetical protein